ncbi:alpha-glucosidase-like [Chironomus tepperi]|uniref:alpha-glucosidase-like n=1 Tax=Chironomus tepperi TaxID=113505 RepID=UPI00391F715F
MALKVLFILLTIAIIGIHCDDDKEWWRTATFYQIYPRSFMDTTDNGIGDIKGMISRLDHLKDAGFDTFWLSPIFKSPQKDTGYDVSDYYQIEPDYGTMEDFDNLVKRAKELGLRLMLDFIPNHTSDQHQWFINSKANVTEYRDYYVWHDGRPNPQGGQPLLPNNWLSVFGGPAWTWVETRQQYYLHQFYPEQPDLNYRSAKVREEMSAMLKFYIDKGVSGYRLDAINHLYEDDQFRDEPHSPNLDREPTYYDDLQHIHTKDLNETFLFVYFWRDMIDKYRVEKNITTDILVMTEAYASTYDTMRYYRSPTDSAVRGAHMPFNFQLIFNFRKSQDVRNGIFEWLNNMPEGETANWVAGSHDHSRTASRVAPEKIHMVNTVVLTLPGASITYYGEEIGMHDNNDVPNWDSRNKNRTPMQWNGGNGAGFTTKRANETWLPIHPNYHTINLQSQREQEVSTYKYFQTLTKLRKGRVIRDGSFDFKIINDDVFGFTREIENEEGYLILINTSGMEQHVNLSNFTTLNNDTLRVLTAAPNSRFKAGDTTGKNDVTLGLYDAAVFHYTAAASSIVLSMTLLLSAVFVFLFN